jgi:DUF971 family protein
MPPSQITISDDRKQLEIEWIDGTSSHLAASHLRANCRSARALRSTLDQVQAERHEDVEILAFNPIGNYGINLVFSDGHDRGIYPWDYLIQLSDPGAPSEVGHR